MQPTTSGRLSDGAAATAAAARGCSPVTGVPQLAQNWVPGCNSAPQWLQIAARGGSSAAPTAVPQVWQNRAPGSSPVPQLIQNRGAVICWPGRSLYAVAPALRRKSDLRSVHLSQCRDSVFKERGCQTRRNRKLSRWPLRHLKTCRFQTPISAFAGEEWLDSPQPATLSQPQVSLSSASATAAVVVWHASSSP